MLLWLVVGFAAGVAATLAVQVALAWDAGARVGRALDRLAAASRWEGW